MLMFPTKEAKTKIGGKPSCETVRVGILTGKGNPFAEPRSAKKQRKKLGPVFEWRDPGPGVVGKTLCDHPRSLQTQKRESGFSF